MSAFFEVCRNDESERFYWRVSWDEGTLVFVGNVYNYTYQWCTCAAKREGKGRERRGKEILSLSTGVSIGADEAFDVGAYSTNAIVNERKRTHTRNRDWVAYDDVLSPTSRASRNYVARKSSIFYLPTLPLITKTHRSVTVVWKQTRKHGESKRDLSWG